jgi:hypothetical protein
VLYKNNSILRQHKVGRPPYPLTNSALERTALYSVAAKFLIAVHKPQLLSKDTLEILQVVIADIRNGQ